VVSGWKAVVHALEPTVRFASATNKRKYKTKAATTAEDVLRQVFPEGVPKSMTGAAMLCKVKNSEAFLDLPGTAQNKTSPSPKLIELVE
jgi:hypothetical protein